MELVSVSASAAPTKMPPPEPPTWPFSMTRPSSAAEIAFVPSLILNTWLAPAASMVMSACPLPLISPLMVMPSWVIKSGPLVRTSVPPKSPGANVMVSLPGVPLASARASRSERPSFGLRVSASVVTIKFAIGFFPSLTVVRPLSWLCRDHARAYRVVEVERVGAIAVRVARRTSDHAHSVVHCALNEAARGVRSVLQVERAKRRAWASAMRVASLDPLAAGLSQPLLLLGVIPPGSACMCCLRETYNNAALRYLSEMQHCATYQIVASGTTES